MTEQQAREIEELRRRLAEVEAERDAARAEVARLQQPDDSWKWDHD